MRQQHATGKIPALNSIPNQHVDDDVINIQLPYNSNRPTKPHLWDSNFLPIPLYNSLEHLVLNSKNINESLNYLAKYIGNKNIDTSKANNVEDLKGIGVVVWNLILSIYTLEWDSLYTDKNKNLFRQKVSSMCTSKAISIKNGKKGKKNSTKSASIERLPSLIPAKSVVAITRHIV